MPGKTAVMRVLWLLAVSAALLPVLVSGSFRSLGFKRRSTSEKWPRRQPVFPTISPLNT